MSLFNTPSADVTLHESCPCGAKLVVEGMSTMIEPYVHFFRVSHWACTQALTKVQPCAHDFNLESTAPSCRLCGEPYRPPENTTITHYNDHGVSV